MILTLIDLSLLLLLVVVAVAVVRTKDLFASTMLLGIYSLLTASIFVTLDAVDVAFTEAAVGAGISTILALSTLSLTDRKEKAHSRSPLIPLIVCGITGGALVYGTFDMPRFGDPDAPIHQHVAPHYLEASAEEIDIPNVFESLDLCSINDQGTLGLYYLARFWDKYRRLAFEYYDTTLAKTEFELDIKLAALVGVNLQVLMAKALEFMSSFNAFEAWVDSHVGSISTDAIDRFNGECTKFQVQ